MNFVLQGSALVLLKGCVIPSPGHGGRVLATLASNFCRTLYFMGEGREKYARLSQFPRDLANDSLLTLVTLSQKVA